ncbi:uncharacterized protein LOC128682553 [Plodia interpunctella]|uniref:uncharacterized protein LOC128682553 n=1 Tax=Plodia interpunctella TaxID=58824 RepID=UPI0023683DDD|nr:uncharacterized protein LOC128682553 isoform X1 [Plodia interpunctella]XP_053623295.1 uncharacterized protein LOC128682553 isoform X1 [Plodia interpunctella]XP_053623296.1 uncharacterized protein LOC128682553 isoform X1 [Plodia interpunctella]
MAYGRIVSLAILTVACQVSSWTIDLPDARKLFFTQNKDENAIQSDNGTKSYNNIEPNSFHNAEDYYYDKYVTDNQNIDFDSRGYAEGFKHEGYMEKKVRDVVRRGGVYLDGLKRALERYAEVLKNCSRINFNQTRNATTSNRNRDPPFPFPASNFTQASDFGNTNYSIADVPAFNFTSTNFSALNPAFSNRESMAMCAEATKRREHVRRLTDLAIWTTKRLEDNAYDAKYNEHREQEQNELLLKLSWFLDRLAHYTGFEPDVQAFVNVTTTARPPTDLSPSVRLPFADVPRAVVQQMMDCLRRPGPAPATERCRYPLPLPDAVQRAYESRDPRFANTRPQDPSLSVISTPNDAAPAASDLEILVTADSAADHFSPKRTQRPNVKSIQKRSLQENPLTKFMKYYGKHKIWVNSNPIDGNVGNSDHFDVPNRLPAKTIEKRSIFKKHIHLKIPEPFHALRDHMKKEAAVHYVNNKEQVKLIKGTLEKIRHSASLTIKHNLKKFDHIKKIHKRSVHYGRKYLPRLSENPYQDLSYYSKNAKGVEYNYDPAQAALVRLGLEQVFQTGNIEVVRRYGANFNPLDPNPFFSGLLRASIDV